MNSSDPETGGAAMGGRGGPEDELLEDGQEEVFSRTEVELGRVEHKSEAGSGEGSASPTLSGGHSGGRRAPG